MNPLDVDDQPPYVEVYSHHPLMYLSLIDYQQQACQLVPPRELLYWCHGVQCKIDAIAGRLGLYKIKMMGQQGPSCMFTISPDVPPKQQADVLLTAAQMLRATLAQVLLPGGQVLATQITIHAGRYAGGVIGRGSWTYDLFGSDVQDVVDMDKYNNPNCIQVSDSALALMSDARQFEVHSKVACSGQEVTLHRWRGQDHGASPDDAALSTEGARAAHAFMSAAGHLHSTELAKHSAAATKEASGQQMQKDLTFRDPELETAYLGSQSHQLARMDMVFVAVTVVMVACLACSSSSVVQLLLASCGQWLVPAVAAAWHLAQPRLYARWREPLWVVHRVLSALNIGAVLACSLLVRQGMAAGFSSSFAWCSGVLQKGLFGLVKRGAVITLAESLGFRVRLRIHLFTSGLNAAVAVLYVWWQWINSSNITSPPFAELALRLIVSCVAPTVLLYLWELEERSWFLTGQRRGARKLVAASACQVASTKTAAAGLWVWGQKQKVV